MQFGLRDCWIDTQKSRPALDGGHKSGPALDGQGQVAVVVDLGPRHRNVGVNA